MLEPRCRKCWSSRIEKAAPGQGRRASYPAAPRTTPPVTAARAATTPARSPGSASGRPRAGRSGRRWRRGRPGPSRSGGSARAGRAGSAAGLPHRPPHRPPPSPQPGRGRRLMPSSARAAGSAGAGASVISSWACWFLGKAITSRMFSTPSPSMTSRSIPGGEATVGWHPVAEGVEQEAELGLGGLGVDAQGGEDAALDRRVGDPDAAAADLPPVEHDVVGPRADPLGGALEQLDVLAVEHGEGVVERGQLAGLVVALEHRELGDPEHVELARRRRAGRAGPRWLRRAPSAAATTAGRSATISTASPTSAPVAAATAASSSALKNLAIPPVQPSARRHR